MPPAHKKVVVRLFSGTLHWGYLPVQGLRDADHLSLMQMDGYLKRIPFSNIKTIAYVRDFNLDDPANPERLGRRAFPARPRGDGLWVRLHFHDEDQLEGLATFSIAFLDSLVQDHGFFLTPPDTRGNTQRLFIPRLALRSIDLLGYVTAPSKRQTASASPDPQPGLFEDPELTSLEIPPE